MTGDSTATRARRLDTVLAALPYVSLLGLVGVASNLLLSFEDPHAEMLLLSTMLFGAAPAGFLVHLAATPDLTGQERRMWLNGLITRKGMSLFAAYFDAGERRTVLVPKILTRSIPEILATRRKSVGVQTRHGKRRGEGCWTC